MHGMMGFVFARPEDDETWEGRGSEKARMIGDLLFACGTGGAKYSAQAVPYVKPRCQWSNGMLFQAMTQLYGFAGLSLGFGGRKTEV